eukprot:795193-Prorocentrum_minimum.AAC.1
MPQPAACSAPRRTPPGSSLKSNRRQPKRDSNFCGPRKPSRASEEEIALQTPSRPPPDPLQTPSRASQGGGSPAPVWHAL